MPIRNALPLIAVNGVPVGAARQSEDSRTLTTISRDVSVLKAKDVRLIWSADLGRNKAQPGKAPTGDTTDAEWLKAPQGPPLAVDPGAAGPYAVDKAEYNLGDQAVYLPGLGEKSEILGKVYSPHGAVGARPLVIFLHGRNPFCYGNAAQDGASVWPCRSGEKPVPSYAGYDGPATALASNGYQVVSISANAVNAFDGSTYDQGAQARAELILDHLALWKQWSTTGGGPFGSRFVGKVDLSNVGLMGHSRGGEGVVRAAALNADRGGQYGIRAVLPLAPTDFARSTVPGVAMSIILPYCDGDVSDLGGQKFYDDSRYSVTGDAATRSTVLVMGANHNFFNTEWTPGQSVSFSIDDWHQADEKAAPCGAKYAGRLTPKEQQAVGTAYVAGFFRLQLGHETKLLPLLDGSNAHPASAGRAVVRVVSQAPLASRQDVSRLDEALPSGAVVGSARAAVCAGLASASQAAVGPTGPKCLTTADSSTSPHWNAAYYAQSAPTTAVTKLTWTGTNGVMRVDVGAAQRNVSRYSALTFRATPDPSGAPRTDLTVRVIDGHGGASSIPVSAVSDALLRLPGSGEDGLSKNLLRTVRIPTSSLTGVDLRDVRAIELRTDKVASGSVFVSDLAFSIPGVGESGPTRVPTLSVTDGGKVAEGDDATKDVDLWVKLSRPSSRPVSVSAETGGDLGSSVGHVAEQVVFEPGQTRHKITVAVTGNTMDSEDLKASLVLSAPVEAQLGESFGRLLVVDDDATPALTISPARAAESAGSIKFAMRLSAPSEKFVIVKANLVDGTAMIRQDFTAIGDDGSTVPPDRFVETVLEPGQTVGAVEAALVDDKVKEDTETFALHVISVDSATFAAPTDIVATIIDDD
ncbi:Calx-beta domain-containing protein [Kribbella sp. NPDC051587]|uniref:Calx-beta domain-containing protein n=1 Tax=Kribbella sp. NPDC051587 TaxID=3364119 RepID=UPI003790D8A9